MGEIFSMINVGSFSISLVSFLIIIGIIIFIHELGHYLTARVLGVQVHEFAIGMGPVIKQIERVTTVGKDSYRTLWSLRLIPFGGFCRMAGMTSDEQETKTDSMGMGEEYDDQPVIPGMGFSDQPAWKRFFILLNGSAFNIFLAWILIAALLGGRGVQDMNDTRIGTLLEGFPAQAAGFQPNDRITEVNGMRVTEWREMSDRLRAAAVEGDVTFTVERGAQVFTITTALPFSEEHGSPMLGITPGLARVPVTQSLNASVWFLRDLTMLKLRGIRDMITGREEADVLGPVGIASMSGRAMRDGLESFVSLLALINFSIGLLNLFPIPALDGGRIIFLLLGGVFRLLEAVFWFFGATFRFLGAMFQFLRTPLRLLEKISQFLEAVFRRGIPEKVENWINTVGLVLLLSLMVFATWNDISNLFFAG